MQIHETPFSPAVLTRVYEAPRELDTVVYVLRAASPLPLSLLLPLGVVAVAFREVRLRTGPRHGPGEGCRIDGMHKSRFPAPCEHQLSSVNECEGARGEPLQRIPTNRCYCSVEGRRVLRGRAVPATVPELVLTLLPPQSGSVRNHLHYLFIARADPPLLLREIKKFVADLVLGHMAKLMVARQVLPHRRVGG